MVISSFIAKVLDLKLKVACSKLWGLGETKIQKKFFLTDYG